MWLLSSSSAYFKPDRQSKSASACPMGRWQRHIQEGSRLTQVSPLACQAYIPPLKTVTLWYPKFSLLS